MIYFDNAATTIHKPKCVIEAVSKALCSMGNSGRGSHDGAMNASRMIYEARVALNEFFYGESAECIIFTSNATHALNIAIKGLLEPDDHVITTALEHNSVLRPLYELEQQGLDLTILSVDQEGNLNYDDIEKAIRPNTKMIITTHGSNLLGNLLDVKRIGKIASKHNLLYVVDASQTAGIIPINVQDMHIDVLCFTGHKGLLGPQGTGGLYVKKGIEIKPLLTGGSGVQTYLKHHPKQMPTSLEAGTLNGHGIAGLKAALAYINEIGLETIMHKEEALMWYFYQQVSKIPGIKIYGDFTSKPRCPIVSLNIRDYDSAIVSDALYQEYNIATRPGAHCAPLLHQSLNTVEQGAVRFSFSHFNTEAEINYTILALKELAREE